MVFNNKQYELLDDLVIFPSTTPTIEVNKTTDNLGGIYRYRVKLNRGVRGTYLYDNKKTSVINFTRCINGKVEPGFQSEQLILIILDRCKKLHKLYPDNETLKIQIQALETFLSASEEQFKNYINK